MRKSRAKAKRGNLADGGSAVADREWEFVQELLASSLFRTIFMWGPPGIGKTFAAYKMGRIDRGVFPVTLTPETPASELMGHFVPRGNELVWRDGPFTAAMRAGGRLVINEVEHASSDVLAILYPVLESAETAQLILPTTEIVAPAEGFHVIATNNEPPDNLPLALQDRFECEVHIKHPHPDALAKLDPALQRAALRTMSLEAERVVSMRRWQTIARLQNTFGLERACRAVLGAERGAQVYDAIILAEKPTE